MWGGWLNFEFSKIGGKHSGWTIKTIYKKLDRGAYSFFNAQFNLESENRFDLLAKGHETKSIEILTSKSSFISGLKFSSININSIRGKKLELLAFIDFRQSQILAIQETKIDNSILTSELFPESFPFSVYR